MQRQYKITAQTIEPRMSSDTIWLGDTDGNWYMPSSFAYFFDYREIVIYGVNNAIFF